MNKVFISALTAGLIISLGGTAYLAAENRVVGAVLFAVGLFTILSFGLNLFTGKVCYTLQNDRRYFANLCLIWLGNLCGTALAGGLLRLTRHGGLLEKAADLSAVKIGDGPLSLFILGIFCGMLMYTAVECYKSLEHPQGKYLAIFICVPVFIIAGFEHCIANMFFFSVGGAWSGAALLHLLMVTLGNAVGGMLLPTLRRVVRT